MTTQLAGVGGHQDLPTLKCERVIFNSIPTMDLNVNSHLTLNPEMLKVNVNDEGCDG